MLLIKKYSHHFSVTVDDPIARREIVMFCSQLVSYIVTRKTNGEIIREKDKVFASRTLYDNTFRFHIEMFDKFIRHIEIQGLKYEITEVPMYEPAKCEFPINKNFEPRDYQIPLIDFIKSDGYKKVITLQTGRGKTAVFLFSVAQCSVRTALVIKPKYFERWITDLNGSTNPDAMLPLKPGKDVLAIRGSEDLNSLINLAKSGELTAKFIIISNITLFKYIEDYIADGVSDKYSNVKPQELWELLGVGILGVDEGHEYFHACFNMELYSNVPKIITLTATPISDDAFLEQMHHVLYPSRYRRDGGAYVKYANVLYTPYVLELGGDDLRTSWPGRTDYNQIAFEMSLLKPKNKKRKENMFKMLKLDVDEYFMVNRFKEYKLLVFFDSVEMCKEFVEYLKPFYPNLKIGKYSGGESYELLTTLDVIVATTKSADTGVDIPNLQMVFCFVARGSSKSNLQMFGRLRKPKDPEVTPVFVYYYCTSIKAHRSYHESRLELFRDKTLYIGERRTGCVI